MSNEITTISIPVDHPLTTTEAATLDDCEQVIDRHRKFFVEVGEALATATGYWSGRSGVFLK